MLKGHSLLYFAPERWEGMWRNRQQLMSIFARDNSVLFVEPRPHLRRLLARGNRHAVDHPSWRDPTVRSVADHLSVLRYPLWGALSPRAPFKQIGAAVRRRTLAHAMQRLGMARPIVWISRPDMEDIVAEIPDPRLLVYHVVDEYSAYHGVGEEWRRKIEAAEQRLLARADLVIVVSENLLKAKRVHNPHTYLVANGVDFELYARALADENLPASLAAIPAPRLGYIGHISERLDLPALTALARQKPEWSLVFLGEVRFAGPADAWQKLVELPNVHHLGAVNVREVPSYVKGFDVGLMPYVLDRHSDNVSPLKLYDYFAAGIPVVSARIQAVLEFSRYVELVGPGRDYVAAASAALAQPAAGRPDRLALAKASSWERRVEQLSTLIEARLADTAAGAARA